MFGLFMMGLVGIGALLHSIRKSGDDFKSKNEAYRKGEWTYVDHAGAIRRVSDDKYLNFHYVDFDHHKDYCAFDSSGNVVRNMSKEARDIAIAKNKQLAIENGNSVYLYPVRYYHVNRNGVQGDYIGCNIYIDFETGDKYFCYQCGLKYYIRLKDAKIIRVADEDSIKRDPNKWHQYFNGGEVYQKYCDEWFSTLQDRLNKALNEIDHYDLFNFTGKYATIDLTVPYSPYGGN